MHGLLAEVVKFLKDRKQYQDTYTKQCIITSVLVKPTNLKIHLSIKDAAKACKSIHKSDEPSRQENYEHIERCRQTAMEYQNMSGTELVKRLKDDDK
mmetsp:Transcript_7626/g.8798  ORF Transcript_7626/g.8798 Transcript_7626/m.8798 type:complete len:97 (+) Transcript_7626:189-479(+)